MQARRAALDYENVGSRHNSDIPARTADVRPWGQSGIHLLALTFPGFDPKRAWSPVIS